jgi:AcrR family transcriptional regulator
LAEVVVPRPDVSETRKSQILDAAASVFARLGFSQARMDDIAAEAGLSKGALYLYYKSKDAIIFAILRMFFAHALHNLGGLRGSSDPVADQLLALMRYVARETERMAPLRPVAFEFYAIAARHAGVRDYFKDYFARFRDILAAIIQQGVDRGEFRPTVDAQTAAITVSSLLEGLALLWMVDPEAVQPGRHGEQAMRLLLEGLRAETPRTT